MTQFCYYFQLLIHICKAKTKKGENKTKKEVAYQKEAGRNAKLKFFFTSPALFIRINVYLIEPSCWHILKYPLTNCMSKVTPPSNKLELQVFCV